MPDTSTKPRAEFDQNIRDLWIHAFKNCFCKGGITNFIFVQKASCYSHCSPGVNNQSVGYHACIKRCLFPICN